MAITDAVIKDLSEMKQEPLILTLISYIRSIIVGPLLTVWTFLFGTFAIVILTFIPSQKVRDFFYVTWGKGCVALLGIKITLRGIENYPKPGEPGAVCLFNHTSNYDIPLINSAIPRMVRWGAKIELFKIPIFGQILKAMGVLPIVRNQRSEVLKMYRKSIPRVQKGECFFLAPEGTRQDGSKIHPFKTGPFIFAIESQSPVIPIVSHGIWRILPKGKIFPCWGRWKHEVIIEILPPIQTKGMSLEDRPTLQSLAFQKMTETFNHHKSELG